VSDEINVNSPAKTPLRLIGRSESGSGLELTDDAQNYFTVAIDDALRSAVAQPRLAAVANPDVERAAFSVKEIQARLRSGESIDAISRTTDWSAEKIEKFAGPILQERAYVIDLALKSALRRDASSPLLGEQAFDQLSQHGANMEEVEWNTHRNADGSWSIILFYPSRDGINTATWSFDLAKQILIAQDDSARWIAGDAREPRRTTPTHGIVYGAEGSNPPPTLTPSTPAAPTAPRLVAVREEIDIIEDENGEEEIVEILELDIDLDEPIEDESDPRSDGVTSRPKIPSWDDIMFGGSSKPSNSDEND